MTISIDDLVAELQAESLWSLLFNLASAAGLPVTAMQEIEAPRSLITTFSSWAASTYNTVVRNAIRAQYGDFVVDAGRTWATFWGLSMYGVAPDDAGFAEGDCILTNTKGGNWVFAPGTFFVSNTLSTKRFVNLETVTLPPWGGVGAFPTQTVRFRAVEASSSSSSGAGTITTVVTSANGVLVSNPTSFVGQDEEPLLDFVARARGTPALLSPNGPKAAYETILRRTLRTDGSRILVNRVKTKTPAGNGTVRTVVAGPSGAVAPTDVPRLLTSLRSLAEPWGVTAQVVSATNVSVGYDISAWAKESPTVTGVGIQVSGLAALQAFINDAPIGGWNTSGGDSGFVYADELACIVSASLPDIFKAENTMADIVVGDEGIPVLGTGTITPVIV